MNLKNLQLLKSLLTLLVLFALVLVLPKSPIDPWNVLIPQKVALLIFSLVIIQVLGSILGKLIGPKAGAILTGFLGGILSSTATTAALARNSSSSEQKVSSVEILTFLSATLAMLFEAMTIVFVGSNPSQLSLLVVFIGPTLGTIFMILALSRKLSHQKIQSPSEFQFRVGPVIKLSGFVLVIIALSKVLQIYFGTSGLYPLTFLISLFEIHGSMIANLQLYESGAIQQNIFAFLICLSILASYVSKIFLISTLGSPVLKRRAYRCTAVALISLGLSWLAFHLFIAI